MPSPASPAQPNSRAVQPASSLSARPSRPPFAWLAALCAPLLLAACGFQGTDREDADAPAEAPTDPVLAAFETVDIPDAEARPQMQLQVVLDRQGFGPGVIDGREGLSTTNALKGFQEASGLTVSGALDDPTRQALARWAEVPATRVVRIPESWGSLEFRPVPETPAEQAAMAKLGYESLDEMLAERFHTTVEVLVALNPDGRPAGVATSEGPALSPTATPSASPPPGVATPSATATPAAPIFAAGQLVRVPNVAEARIGADVEDGQWRGTLASLGVDSEQPEVARIVVDESESWLKAYDEEGRLVAMFTVTSGSRHDPLPLGEWSINGVSRNPPYTYNPEILRNAPDGESKRELPPGPNSPVGVVWIDLTKEHYGIHGTPDPETIGRAQSNGCVRLTNWDAARLAQMVSGSTQVLFQA